jgi:hypothetical protein
MRKRSRRQLGRIVNDTQYRDETPARVVEVLEMARANPTFPWKAGDVDKGERICIRYGDPETGRDWGDPPMCGTVGRSSGTPGRDYTNKIPLLLKSKKSSGGEAIIDHKIIRITRGAKPKNKHGVDYVLYSHPKYSYPEGDRAAQVESIAKDAEREARAADRAGDRPKAEALRVQARKIRSQRFEGRRRR